MKNPGRIRFLLCCLIPGALAGCTTYVEQTRPPTVYVSPPPVYVEPPRVSVAPPVYVPPAQETEVEPAVEIRTENDFYGPLSPYGRWENVEPYGRCWIPTRVEADWRPYCDGHWERTEAGWYWASNEPWGWATYHYGRWDLSPRFGWYWVPQTRWAPAWVSWHHGGGYLGWAPLHPSVRIERGGPLEVDVNVIPRQGFVFVEEKRFLEPVRPKTVVVNNTTIINKTVNITNVKVVNNTVINEGPRTEIIQQVSGRKVQPVPVHELRHKEEAVVIAEKQGLPPRRNETIQTPVRPRVETGQTTVQPEQRARELHEKAHEDSRKAAKELETKAQLESEAHSRELQRKAQQEAQIHAKELERKAQLESQQRSRELQQKAREEAQRTAKELEKKAQLESQQHASELQKKAQEDSSKAAKEFERKAQVQAEQRASELHQKAHEQMERTAKIVEKKEPLQPQRRGQEAQPGSKSNGPGEVHKFQKKKAEEQKIPPPAAPQ